MSLEAADRPAFDLLPLQPFLRPLQHARAAPRLVRAKTRVRVVATFLRRSTSTGRFLAASQNTTFCSTREAVVATVRVARLEAGALRLENLDLPVVEPRGLP